MRKWLADEVRGRDRVRVRGRGRGRVRVRDRVRVRVRVRVRGRGRVRVRLVKKSFFPKLSPIRGTIWERKVCTGHSEYWSL